MPVLRMWALVPKMSSLYLPLYGNIYPHMTFLLYFSDDLRSPFVEIRCSHKWLQHEVRPVSVVATTETV